jgi:hypothetical protein
VLTYEVVKKLLQEGCSSYLDRYQHLVKNYRNIVGPYLIKQNDWLALIIDLETSRFFLQDPLLMESTLLMMLKNLGLATTFQEKILIKIHNGMIQTIIEQFNIKDHCNRTILIVAFM